ncbi:MAG: hypothetical protein HGA49_10790 [Eubacteriaceae bacterium]|nr:hypothetical protein [Eubacteriaceae bacterium]
MNKIILTDIPFQITRENIINRLQLRMTNRTELMLSRIMEYAHSISKPKALYFPAVIENRGEKSITIEGKSFHSEILSLNTAGIRQVFPYIITCGQEVEDYYSNTDSIMEKFILDGINSSILECSTNYVAEHIKESYGIQEIHYHIPGCLNDWPIEEQRDLFELMGEVTEKIGVHLSDSFMMRPSKSVSGIYY